MSVRNFVPEIWSARFLVALRKALIYGGPMLVNRDYEGEISEAGDTVRITSVSRPTIGNYVPGNTTITPEKLNTAQRTLLVDQAKFWAFELDDVDARQAMGGLIPQAMSEAAYAMADVVDRYLASFYTSAQASNVVSEVTIDLTSPADADTEYRKVYDNVLVPLKVKLDEANVPTQGRYAAVPPWVHGVLLRDPRFVKANEAGTTEGLRNGNAGNAAGFNIMLSNNAPNPTGSSYIVQAGTSAAVTFAEQINKTEAYRPQDSFSDAVKGLALYGAKVVRPDCLAYATVTSS
jgi:hypothetical protein